MRQGVVQVCVGGRVVVAFSVHDEESEIPVGETLVRVVEGPSLLEHPVHHFGHVRPDAVIGSRRREDEIAPPAFTGFLSDVRKVLNPLAGIVVPRKDAAPVNPADGKEVLEISQIAAEDRPCGASAQGESAKRAMSPGCGEGLRGRVRRVRPVFALYGGHDVLRQLCRESREGRRESVASPTYGRHRDDRRRDALVGDHVVEDVLGRGRIGLRSQPRALVPLRTVHEVQDVVALRRIVAVPVRKVDDGLFRDRRSRLFGVGSAIFNRLQPPGL